MKKVIPNKTDTVQAEFIDNDSIIGFQNNASKFFLIRKDNKYQAIGTTNIKSVSRADYPSVRNCASCNHDNCYLFDNYSELFKWLSE